MLLTSIPPAINHGAAGAGIAVAMVFIGLGVGGVKATINVFIGSNFHWIP
jgi:POT family proton-dependent oligopeptide transporter